MLQRQIIGYRRNGSPIWLVQGAADGDADGDGSASDGTDGDSGASGDAGDGGEDPTDAGEGGEPEGDDDDGGEPEGDPPAPKAKSKTKQPPPAETDLDRVKAALTKERQARKQADKDLAALRRQHATAEERALLEAWETAATEREAQVKPPLLKALAAAELRAAGVQGNGAQRLVGLLDLEQVDLDDDGAPVGLDEQISALKEEFPNLFAAPSDGKTRAGNANAGSGSGAGRRQDKTGNDGKPRPWNEILADQVLNPQYAVPPGVGR